MPRTSRRRRSWAGGYRETLHELNQRYRREWDRAERLQDELDEIKKSRSYRLLCWWRRLARLWRNEPTSAASDRDLINAFPVEYLDERRSHGSGTVSIVIPFRDQVELLRNCLRSLRRCSYRPMEVLLLDNGSTSPRTLRYLDRLQLRPEYRVFSCPGPFNFSRLCNRGGDEARGDFLVFLNNDVEALALDWLERLVELGGRPDIGIVGATLLYPDGALQHAGIFPDKGGRWRHVYRGCPQTYAGEARELVRARTVPAVTGACMLIRRDLFMEMGEFDARYPVTHNDIDLCCRVRKRGLKVAVSPHARLWHFESVSRGYSRENLMGTE